MISEFRGKGWTNKRLLSWRQQVSRGTFFKFSLSHISLMKAFNSHTKFHVTLRFEVFPELDMLLRVRHRRLVYRTTQNDWRVVIRVHILFSTILRPTLEPLLKNVTSAYYLYYYSFNISLYIMKVNNCDYLTKGDLNSIVLYDIEERCCI